MVTLSYVEQGTEQWKLARAGKFTGSNAEKLLSSFGASEYAKAINDSFKGNFYTKRGHLLEQEAIMLYEKIYKQQVHICGYATNSKYPTALYSPDGLLEDTLIEVKCFNKEKHKAMYNGNISLKVLAQIHFGMLICEKKQAHLLIYNPDFAKKVIDGVNNSEYNPKLAFKCIVIKRDAHIQNNFKRILSNV